MSNSSQTVTSHTVARARRDCSRGSTFTLLARIDMYCRHSLHQDRAVDFAIANMQKSSPALLAMRRTAERKEDVQV